MEYPLGPFPSELLILIIGTDPTVYRLLALTSKRVLKAIEPVLREIGQLPVSKRELIRFLADCKDGLPEAVRRIYIQDVEKKSSFGVLLKMIIHVIKPYDNYPSRIVCNAYPMKRCELLDPEELEPLLDEDLNFDPITLYLILQRRTSCVKFNKNHAKDRAWNHFRELCARYPINEYLKDQEIGLTNPC